MAVTVEEVIAEVESFVGVPYVFGGDTRSGVDCSGLIFAAMLALGVGIPRTTEGEWLGLRHISAPVPGALVSFDVPSDGAPQPAHVGMWLAPDRMVSAPHTGTRVQYSTIPNDSSISIMGYLELPVSYDLPVPVFPSFAPPEGSMIAETPQGGLTVAGADGGIFNFDGSPYFGSLPGLKVTPLAPIVGIAITPSGQGYWLVGQDGGVFCFGDAPFLGALPDHPEWQAGGTGDPAVGIAPWPGGGTPQTGQGYTVVCRKPGAVPTLYQFPGDGRYINTASAVKGQDVIDVVDGKLHRVAYDARKGV